VSDRVNPTDAARERASAAPRETERHGGAPIAALESTLDILPIGLMLARDAGGRELRVNRRGAGILGIGAGTVCVDERTGEREAAGMRYRLQRGETPLSGHEYPLQRTLTTRQAVWDEDLRVVRADGGVVDILVSTTPLLDRQEQVRGALAVFTDITRYAEQQRLLEVRGAQQAAISELSFYGITQSDVQRVMERAARAAQRTLGAELVAVLALQADAPRLSLQVGEGWDAGTVGTTEIAADSRSPIGRALDARGPVVVEDAERDPHHAEPRPGPLAAHGVRSTLAVVIPGVERPYGVLSAHCRTPRRFSPNEGEFLQAVANLISAALERNRMERQLARQRQRLAVAETERAMRRAEQLASLGTLAAGVAHEINNPLNSIMVHAELGLRRVEKGASADQLRERFQTIIEEVKRCGAITHDVLSLSKEESKSPDRLADLNEVVQRARELMTSHLQMLEALVELDLAELPPVHLNTTTMQHVVVNLLRNAAEAGGHGVHVRISTRHADDTVVLRVSDDGPGIPEEHLDKVFDPFFSLRREDGGTGLGLNLVRRTVLDHGGTVGVESPPGGGTTFTVRLPVPRAEDAA